MAFQSAGGEAYLGVDVHQVVRVLGWNAVPCPNEATWAIGSSLAHGF